MEWIVKYHGDIFAIAEEVGATAEDLLQGYAILTLPKEAVGKLYTYPQIEHIEAPKHLSLEAGRRGSCIPPVQAETPWNLRGAGVLVAVIDSGLDYRHPDFRNPDGTTRLRAIWDQTAKTGTAPLGFQAGAEYKSAQIDQALATDTPLSSLPYSDERGHGTAVTGIAAGNGRASGGKILGVAPDATLLSVKLGTRGYASFARTTELMRAVKYVIDEARTAQMPLAINISLGMNEGAHQGNSLFERYLDDSAQEWKTVLVLPTGNEGGAGHHYAGTVKAFDKQTISWFTAGGLSRFSLSLWKDFVDDMAFTLILPSGERLGRLDVDNPRIDRAVGALHLRMQLVQPTHYSLAQQVFLEVSSEMGAIPSALWKLEVQTQAVVSGQIEAWLPTLEAVGADTFFTQANEWNTLTIPSTASRVISVAGYRERSNSVLDFSGRGGLPYRHPDIAAPASDIFAPLVGGTYDSVTGTSFAAPFVTGAAALLMQWGIVQGNDPFLYGERLKAFLRLGALRSPERQYPNPLWGYGTLCVERSLDALLRYQQGRGERIW